MSHRGSSLFYRVMAVFIFSFLSVFSQTKNATIRGKVYDENGEPVIGAVVSLKNNPSKAAATDLNGQFQLSVVEEGKLSIVISYVGYDKVESEFEVKSGELTTTDFTLKPSTSQINEVVVERKATRSADKYYERIKINSASSVDYLSSEVIRKAGDANVASAVARVPGVSTNGSFFTVRGIGDRYIKTTVNGAVLPTLDPFTNNIKLDIFPSALIDNLVITKTATADLPGDWAGALVSIETKDFPDRLTVFVESNFGYNPQSTFKNILSSERSDGDIWGYDSGFRDYDHASFKQVNLEMSQYEEFAGLGMKDYFNSIGISDKTPWKDVYTKLGLIELGFLSSGQFNDADAYTAALLKYRDSGLTRQSFRSFNAQAVKANMKFNNAWVGVNRRGPMNFSQNIGVGNQLNLFGKPLGFFAGFRYSLQAQFDPDSRQNRAIVDVNNERGLELSSVQQSTREANGWNSLINLSYKPFNNHSVSFLFMPNISGSNNIRSGIDTANGVYELYNTDQFYEHRRQFVYQAKSEHHFLKIKTKLETMFSFTDGYSEAPDFKNLNYGRITGTDDYIIGGLLAIRRFFRYLDDDILDGAIKFETAVFDKPGYSRKIKYGGFLTINNRESRQYEYFLNFGPNAEVGFKNNDIIGFFNPSDFNFSDYTNSFGDSLVTVDKFYRRVNLDSYRTFGETKIYGGYLATDYALRRDLRLTGGIRLEQVRVFADVFRFDSLRYGVNDERRLQLEDLFIVNPGEINQTPILPSAGVIWRFYGTEEAPFNFRLNFSKTIARPSIRELTETMIYDYEFRNFVFGNSQLKMVEIMNYDMRAEAYFENGDNVSVSLFYKDFKNHIEQIKTLQGFSWQNAESANVYGLEIDVRKGIIPGLEWRANLTLAKSFTEVVNQFLSIERGIKSFIPIDTVQRQMFGQAPYVFNTLLSYNYPKYGITASAGYNVQGPRLVVVSADLTPDVYEMPRHLVDLRLSKNIFKGLSVSVAVRDLLNSPIRRSYKYPEGYSLDFDRFTYGTNYQISVSYRI
jgi:hypothetical protein